MHTAAIVLAAGRGSRMGSEVKKQYIDLCGHPVLWYSLDAFEKSDVDEIVLVCGEDDIETLKREYMGRFNKLTHIVTGGRERYHSVYAGLCALEGCDRVLIHDGARPFVNGEIIDRCLAALESEQACVAAVPSKDTVKITDSEGYAESTPDRSRVWIVQTPQCFHYYIVKKAYDDLIESERTGSLGDLHVTDDAMVVETYTDVRVKMITASYDNIKITTPEDLKVAHAILNNPLDTPLACCYNLNS